MFEQLLKEAEEEGLEVVSLHLQEKIKGLYYDGVIAINKNISTIKGRKQKTRSKGQALGSKAACDTQKYNQGL